MTNIYKVEKCMCVIFEDSELMKTKERNLRNISIHISRIQIYNQDILTFTTIEF